MVVVDESVLKRIFASLQALEKCLANSEKMLTQQTDFDKDVSFSLNEQKKILTSMRRAANRLNVEHARGDQISAYRSLQIFYGLNALVRPEILASFQLLAGSSMTQATAIGAGELH